MPEQLTEEQRKALDKKLKRVWIPYHIVSTPDGVLSEEERGELVRSIRSIFAYTGCIIPPRIELDDGTMVDLKKLVWDLISEAELSDAEVIASRQLADILDKRADMNERIIAEYDLTEEEAEKLYFRTCGLLRAVMELRSLGDKSREDEYARMSRERKIDDAKKLLAFLKSVRV